MTTTPEEYKDIAPYDDIDFKEQMKIMLADPGVERAIRYVDPTVDFPHLKATLPCLNNTEEF